MLPRAYVESLTNIYLPQSPFETPRSDPGKSSSKAGCEVENDSDHYSRWSLINPKRPHGIGITSLTSHQTSTARNVRPGIDGVHCNGVQFIPPLTPVSPACLI